MDSGQDEVTGECRIDGNLGGFAIAQLTHHDDVGVMAQHRAQDCGEGQSDGRIDRDLVDALDLVFDRILDRDQLAAGRIEFRERPGQRRGLAGAGRTGHEHEAVRRFEMMQQQFAIPVREADAFQGHGRIAVLQKADRDAFAVRGGRGRHTQVERPAGDGNARAPILRASALGNVETGEDLHPAGDEARQRRRR